MSSVLSSPSIISSILAFSPLIPPPSPSIIVLIYYSLTSSLIVTVPCTLAWPFLASLFSFFFLFSFLFFFSFFDFWFLIHLFYLIYLFFFFLKKKKNNVNNKDNYYSNKSHFMPYPLSLSAVTVTATPPFPTYFSPCTKRQGPAGFLVLYAYRSWTYFITYHLLLRPLDSRLPPHPHSSSISLVQRPVLPLDTSSVGSPLDLQVLERRSPSRDSLSLSSLHCIAFHFFGLRSVCGVWFACYTCFDGSIITYLLDSIRHPSPMSNMHRRFSFCL